MGNWSKIIIILVILSLGVAFGGYLFYTKEYVKPRKEIAEQKAGLEQMIQMGKNNSKLMSQASSNNMGLYSRSFPTNPSASGLEYQIWLTQMLEFCNVRDAKVGVEKYFRARGGTTSTQEFSVQGQFSLLDLTQFLYEFYWTPFLHRIKVLNILPVEHSELLNVSMTIEGMAIHFKADQNQTYPLVDKLPLETKPIRQTASGPFAAYRHMGDMEIFRAVKTGVDTTQFAKLTGTPVVTDDSGQPTKIARWYLGSDGRTQTFQEGDRMTIGAFDATIAEIDADVGLVLLRQNTGRLWVVPLGYNLSDAVAIPNTIY